MNTYILEEAAHPLDPAVADLAAHGDTLERLPLPADHEDLVGLFEGRPGGVVLLPAVWEDLACVKATGELAALAGPFETLLVGPAPEPAQLVAAFNEGAAGYIEVPPDADKARRVLDRARGRYRSRTGQALAAALHHTEAGGAPNLTARDHYLGRAFARSCASGGHIFPETVGVLVVSSSVQQQKQLAGLIAQTGATVKPAGTLEQAVACCKANGCTLVVTDGQLPDGDAAGLAGALRKAMNDRMPRIIVWSSSPDTTAAAFGPDAPVDAVIPKPGPGAGVEACLPAIIATICEATE
jgi:DNA-binding NtrC family response regulator